MFIYFNINVKVKNGKSNKKVKNTKKKINIERIKTSSLPNRSKFKTEALSPPPPNKEEKRAPIKSCFNHVRLFLSALSNSSLNNNFRFLSQTVKRVLIFKKIGMKNSTYIALLCFMSFLLIFVVNRTVFFDKLTTNKQVKIKQITLSRANLLSDFGWKTGPQSLLVPSTWPEALWFICSL